MLDNYAQQPSEARVLIALKNALADMYPGGWRECDGNWIARVAARVASTMTSDMMRSAHQAGDVASVATAPLYRESVRLAVIATLENLTPEQVIDIVELSVWDRKMIARLDALEAAGRARHWAQN